MDDQEIQFLNKDDFSCFDSSSDFLEEKISKFNLRYRIPSQGERDQMILKICGYLFEKEVVEAGKHRKNQWEDGWKENLDNFIKSGSLDSLIPKIL